VTWREELSGKFRWDGRLVHPVWCPSLDESDARPEVCILKKLASKQARSLLPRFDLGTDLQA
jgi:hypothetical protein